MTHARSMRLTSAPPSAEITTHSVPAEVSQPAEVHGVLETWIATALGTDSVMPAVKPLGVVMRTLLTVLLPASCMEMTWRERERD